MAGGPDLCEHPSFPFVNIFDVGSKLNKLIIRIALTPGRMPHE